MRRGDGRPDEFEGKQADFQHRPVRQVLRLNLFVIDENVLSAGEIVDVIGAAAANEQRMLLANTIAFQVDAALWPRADHNGWTIERDWRLSRVMAEWLQAELGRR